MPVSKQITDSFFVVLTSGFTVGSTTLVAIAPGSGPTFSVALTAGTWLVEAELCVVQIVSAGLFGIGCGYSGTATNNFMSSMLNTATTGLQPTAAQSFALAITDSSTRAAGTKPCRFMASFKASNSGTFTLKAQRSAGTTVVDIGSWMRVQRAA